MESQTINFAFKPEGHPQILTINQLDGEVVVHHPDVDLLVTIAREGMQFEGNELGAVYTSPPAPLDAIVAAAFDDADPARQFVLTAAHVAMDAGVGVALHNDGGWEPGEIRDSLKRQTAASLGLN